MKTGDLMVELRKRPGGRPFKVKVGTEIHDDGHLVDTEEGTFLVFEGKKTAPKKPTRKK